jgi:GntR family transcriptional regulator, arabinose operon transcriptional repressor
MRQFKYEELIEYLKKEISTGNIHPGDKIPSIEELGSRFEISTITITRALNELQKFGYIKRVKGQGSFACEIHQPNQTTISMFQNRLIYCIIPFDASQTELIQSIESTCRERGYFFVFQNSHFSSVTERELIIQARKHGAAGIIVYPVTNIENIEIYSRMVVDNYPFVVIDRKISALKHSFVSCANTESFCMITEYLCQKGHSRIAFVCGDLSLSSTSERFQGYCTALLRFGVPIAKELIVDQFYIQKDKPDDQKVQDMLRYLMSLSPRVTAIACANDLTASIIIQQTDKLNIRIPEDLSITGFDNMYFSSLLKPPLTTMVQPFNEIGKCTVQLLSEMIESKKLIIKEIRCPATIEERKSVATLAPDREPGSHDAP